MYARATVPGISVSSAFRFGYNPKSVVYYYAFYYYGTYIMA